MAMTSIPRSSFMGFSASRPYIVTGRAHLRFHDGDVVFLDNEVP